jgi:hypothetical protein
VRPSLVAIFLVGFEQMAQMPFAEHNNMVKTMPGHEYHPILCLFASWMRFPGRTTSTFWAKTVRAADGVLTRRQGF